MYQSKQLKEARKRGYRFGLICFIAGFLIAWAVKPPTVVKEIEVVSPVPEATATPTPTPHLEPAKEATPPATPAPVEKYVIGTASYYSVEGCVGCDSERIMANGQKLRDDVRTVALTPEIVAKHKLLNKIVTVENIKTRQWVRARVTDTGGFAAYDRVADLSVATKEAINCPSLCEVKVIFD